MSTPQNGALQILYLAVSGSLHAMFVLHYVGGRNAARGLEANTVTERSTGT